MLSRIAESHYWLGRYLERAENTARIVADHHQTLLDAPDAAPGWQILLGISGEQELYEDNYDSITPDHVERFLTFDAGNPSSILACLNKAREAARGIRDQLSSEIWLTLNRCYLALQEEDWASSSEDETRAAAFYERVMADSQLIDGLTATTLLREQGWEFLMMGRHLERALQTTRILKVRYHAIMTGRNRGILPWLAVLRSVSASEAYNKIYQAQVAPINVAEMLILHPNFPRSLRFNAGQLQARLHSINSNLDTELMNEPERWVGRLYSRMVYTRIDEIEEYGVRAYLDKVEQQFSAIGSLLHQEYFGYVPNTEYVPTLLPV